MYNNVNQLAITDQPLLKRSLRYFQRVYCAQICSATKNDEILQKINMQPRNVSAIDDSRGNC